MYKACTRSHLRKYRLSRRLLGARGRRAHVFELGHPVERVRHHINEAIIGALRVWTEYEH